MLARCIEMDQNQKLLNCLSEVLPLAEAYLHLQTLTQGYESPGLKKTLETIQTARELIKNNIP